MPKEAKTGAAKKAEEIVKLRAAEQALIDVVDLIQEELEAVEDALRERGEVPESDSDSLEENAEED